MTYSAHTGNKVKTKHLICRCGNKLTIVGEYFNKTNKQIQENLRCFYCNYRTSRIKR